MPDIPLDQATFDFFARYILSGFLIFLIRNAYVVGERPKIADVALDIVLFGLINQLVWQLLSSVLDLLGAAALAVSTTPEAILAFAPGPRLLFFAEVLALPILIGVLSGRALRKGWTEGLYRLLSIPLTDPIPRAFDHVFLTRGAGFVIVTFKDGTQLPGYYGKSSRVGRDPQRSEIYLQRLYRIGADGTWEELVPPRSILVNISDVRSIEFLEE